MKVYYVADSLKKTRISIEFRKFETAQKYCTLLNEKNPGRFQCGNWVEHSEFLKDSPHEWKWVTQMSDSAYLV